MGIGVQKGHIHSMWMGPLGDDTVPFTAPVGKLRQAQGEESTWQPGRGRPGTPASRWLGRPHPAPGTEGRTWRACVSQQSSRRRCASHPCRAPPDTPRECGAVPATEGTLRLELSKHPPRSHGGWARISKCRAGTQGWLENRLSLDLQTPLHLRPGRGPGGQGSAQLYAHPAVGAQRAQVWGAPHANVRLSEPMQAT